MNANLTKPDIEAVRLRKGCNMNSGVTHMGITSVRSLAWVGVLAALAALSNPLAPQAEAQAVMQRDWTQAIEADAATRDSTDFSRWTVSEQPPEGQGLSVEPGPMIHAGLHHDVVPFEYDPGLTGWHRVFFGFYIPEDITYTGVAAKLDDESVYSCVADPRAAQTEADKEYPGYLEGDFVEAEFKAADLTGRKIIVYHPEGCRSYITHLRFQPMTSEEVEREQASRDAESFQAFMWLDYMDYTTRVQRPQNDWWYNEPKGIHRLIRFFSDYGTNCFGYRFLAGGRSRYPSDELPSERERYIEKLVGNDMRDPYAFYRYGDIEMDILAQWVKWAHFYGKKAYAVWGMEDNHGYPTFSSSFNFEHPEYMARFKDGTFHFGYASLAIPEVVEHKLDVLQEALDRGVDGIVFDLERIDGWFQTRDMEYHHRGVGGWDKNFQPAIVQAYMDRYGVDPREEDQPKPTDAEDAGDKQARDAAMAEVDPELTVTQNRRWIEFLCEYRTEFFREVKKAIERHEEKTGREIDLVINALAVSKDPYESIRVCGVDWVTLAEEGVMDQFSPLIAPENPDGTPRTLDDLVTIMEYVQEVCKDHCGVNWPIAHHKRTLNSLARNSGYEVPQDLAEVVEYVLDEAYDHGAAGIERTTVNYLPIDTVLLYHRKLNGPYRWQK